MGRIHNTPLPPHPLSPITTFTLLTSLAQPIGSPQPDTSLVGFLVVRLPVCILQYFTVKYSILFHHTVFYGET